MYTTEYDANTSAKNALKSFYDAIQKKQKIIPFDANFYFTKGEPGRSFGYILHEIELEENTIHWLNQRVSFQEIISRYKKYDDRLLSTEWPAHYATRFIDVKGQAAKGENIFMFFPEVLGLKTGKMEDY